MDDALRRLLQGTSLRLRPAWLQQQAVEGADAADRLLRLLAAADLRDACEGSLPPNLDRQHDLRVEGQHFLQVLHSVDIANPVAADARVGSSDGPKVPTSPARPVGLRRERPGRC
ncbi:unnamed protein product [Effrenium voratum]|nr:unnamed protein product [Effrenium voratum]